MTSTLPPLVQACSGALGSATANALVYPLDLLTTRLQLELPGRPGVSRSASSDSKSLKHSGSKPLIEHPAIPLLRRTIRRYGLSALYDGVWADTTATLLSNFFYFYSYSFLRRKFQVLVSRNNAKPRMPTIFEELALGFIAGVVSRAISTPLNIVTLRMQTERDDSDADDYEKAADRTAKPYTPSGLVAIMKRIYAESGLSGFWRGFTTTTILSLNPSITLALFQLFRRILALTSRTNKIEANPNPGEAFVGAAISNAIATTLLYPLILAKTLVQSSSTSSSSLSEALTSRGRDGRGAYQALDMQLIKACINQGVTFLVKGRIEQLIVQAYLRRLRTRSGQ